jgi:hypothetical protein
LKERIKSLEAELKEALGQAAIYKDAYEHEVGARSIIGAWSMATDVRCMWSAALEVFAAGAGTGAAARL